MRSRRISQSECDFDSVLQWSELMIREFLMQKKAIEAVRRELEQSQKENAELRSKLRMIKAAIG